MPTPYERIERIIKAHTPSEVVFKPSARPQVSPGNPLILEMVITKERCFSSMSEDADLQIALMARIQELYDSETGKFYISATVEDLWAHIVRAIEREYDKVSPRSKATKKKTQAFIESIRIGDKYLPDFLMKIYLTINSADYETYSRPTREALFEQFESLRKTYGKRSF